MSTMTRGEALKVIIPKLYVICKAAHMSVPELLRFAAEEVFTYPERFTGPVYRQAIFVVREELRYLREHDSLRLDTDQDEVGPDERSSS